MKENIYIKWPTDFGQNPNRLTNDNKLEIK